MVVGANRALQIAHANSFLLEYDEVCGPQPRIICVDSEDSHTLCKAPYIHSYMNRINIGDLP